MMPAWMRYVWKADPDRFVSFARDVFGIEPDATLPRDEAVEAAVLAGIDCLKAFFQSIGMPATLRHFGLQPGEIETFIGTLRKNKGERFGAFMPLTMDDVRAIYASAF